MQKKAHSFQMELNSQENAEKKGIQWEKCMEQNRFFFTGDVLQEFL